MISRSLQRLPYHANSRNTRAIQHAQHITSLLQVHILNCAQPHSSTHLFTPLLTLVTLTVSNPATMPPTTVPKRHDSTTTTPHIKAIQVNLQKRPLANSELIQYAKQNNIDILLV